ncbi:MAG: acetate kinase [Pseudomonadota bacterium]
MKKVSNILPVFVLNCGSSSIKFMIRDVANGKVYLTGVADAIGSKKASLHYCHAGADKQQQSIRGDFADAMRLVLEVVRQSDKAKALIGVGHRVVHGGEYFSASVVIDSEVTDRIRACIKLAPLHNPANLMGIEQAQAVFPQLTHVAVFDTAFHHSLPAHAYIYALPYYLYRDHHIRRYGFHGTNHRYVSHVAADLLNKSLEDSHIISAHLGNGCSLAAIAGGKSVDTTMGLTPLEGLVMGTRCGNIDPSIPGLLIAQHGLSPEAVDQLLNHQSGLLGISELSNDMRELSLAVEQGNQQAKLAIDIFCYQLAKQIAAISVALPCIDALVFTGGIGENAAVIRHQVIAQLQHLKFKIDPVKNTQTNENSDISAVDSTAILVVKANEEAMIAQDVLSLTGE